ncbi:MAG: leucine-rich repeat domain-containing protein [Bacteroidaceae bacterium]|nr:leucine-rich repeat domain-containing protein [Bacteroidaceae bacterium]
MKTKIFFLAALLFMISNMSWAAVTDSGSCGDGVNYRIETSDDGNSYTVTISGSGWMTEFDYYASPEPILPPWSEIRAKITTVVVEEGVHSIGNHAFMECDALSSLTLPSTLEKIGTLTFYHCISLPEVHLPEGFKWLDQAAFHYCTSLKSLVIPSTMTYIPGDGFSSCSSLESVTLPSTMTAIYYKGFADCTSLTNLNLPTSLTFIGDWAFSNTAMPTIVVPGGVTSIGTAAFQCNPNLIKVTVTEGVEVIGGAAFGVCHKLETVVLPSTLKRIDDHAFMAWQNLKDFYCYSPIPDVGSDIFMISYDDGHPDDLSGVTVHVPADAVENYRKTFPWSECGSIVALTANDPKPTSVPDIYSLEQDAEGAYYDLTGRRFTSPIRGLYIRNGKKIIVGH